MPNWVAPVLVPLPYLRFCGDRHGERAGAIHSWTDSPTRDGPPTHVLAAHRRGLSLTIFIDGAVPDDAEALCDEVEHLHISRDGEAVHVALHSNLHPRVVRLVWHDGASNAVVIMDHDRLAQLAKADRTSAHTPMAALLLAGDSEIVAIL